MTTLLVANDGGHLRQLHTLAPRLVDDDVVWATVPTPQSESLLAGQVVVWTDRADTRDHVAVAKNAAMLVRALRRHRPDRAISTGSSLALSALPQCALRRIDAHYIESVTRTDGFSLSGRILHRFPGVTTYTQWPHLAGDGWHHEGSVLDGLAVSAPSEPGVLRSAVVSLGTSKRYGFRRLVERLVDVLPADVDVLWQVGSTDVSGLGIDGRPGVPNDELDDAIRNADLVVAHAGAGIAITALQCGQVPLLVPRRPELDEHVDDHQLQLAARFSSLGLVETCDVEQLTIELMCRTAGLTVSAVPPPPFLLR